MGCHTARAFPPSGVPKEREASAGVHVRASSWSSKKSEPWWRAGLLAPGSSDHRAFPAPVRTAFGSNCVGPVASYGARTRLQRRARAGFSPASRRSRGAAVASHRPAHRRWHRRWVTLVMNVSGVLAQIARLCQSNVVLAPAGRRIRRAGSVAPPAWQDGARRRIARSETHAPRDHDRLRGGSVRPA